MTTLNNGDKITFVENFKGKHYRKFMSIMMRSNKDEDFDDITAYISTIPILIDNIERGGESLDLNSPIEYYDDLDILSANQLFEILKDRSVLLESEMTSKKKDKTSSRKTKRRKS